MPVIQLSRHVVSQLGLRRIAGVGLLVAGHRFFCDISINGFSMYLIDVGVLTGLLYLTWIRSAID
jgi:hypothetical protein